MYSATDSCFRFWWQRLWLSKNFFSLKKWFKLLVAVCLMDGRVHFYSEKRFYTNIDKTFAAPCSWHPYFKERISSRLTDASCNCLNLENRRCYNCKVICFNLNFLVNKIKVGHYFDVSSMVDIAPIEKYLDIIKSMSFFYFCRGFFKVQYSLDHEKYISLIKKISLWFWHVIFFVD